MGQLRNAASVSIDRFKNATVTGQVEFLRFQGDVINLGRRIVNVDGVFKELEPGATDLVKNLTSFEQASKVLSSQFQAIETGLLQAFGPALGNLIGGIQNIFTGSGKIATLLKESPALTAGLFAGALSGKFLFDKAAQIGIITAGTAAGFRIAQGGKAAFTGLAKGGARPVAGAIGGIGLAASGTALAATAESAGGQVAGGLMAAGGGALTGATLGAAGGLPGMIIGGLIGGALGGISALLASTANTPGRQFGGGMDAGQTYLVGEAGPEIITSGTTGTVTANQDLKETFDTTALESKMAAMSTELSNANKALNSMVNGVNTLVAVESRALKAVEKTARKESQVGMV